jgi:lipocalin
MKKTRIMIETPNALRILITEKSDPRNVALVSKLKLEDYPGTWEAKEE